MAEGAGSIDTGELPESTAQGAEPSAHNLRNKRKKQRQKIAKKVKMGLLPAKGKLAEPVKATQGNGPAGIPGSHETDTEGQASAVSKGRTPPPNKSYEKPAEPLAQTEATPRKRARKDDGADGPGKERARRKCSKGERKWGKEKWHSSDALLAGEHGTDEAKGKQPQTLDLGQPTERPSSSAILPRVKKPAMPMVPLAVHRRQQQAPGAAAAVAPAPPWRRPAETSSGKAQRVAAGQPRQEAAVRGGETRRLGSSKDPGAPCGKHANGAKSADGGSNGAEEQEGKGRQGKTFIFGNYSRYYGYRTFQAFDQDPRLGILRKEWFTGKRLLDIGCHEGVVTLAMALRFLPSHATGLDVDARLIEKAKWQLQTAQNRASSRLLLGPAADEQSTLDERSQSGREAAAQLTALRATHFTYGAVQDFDIAPGSWDAITLFSVVKWIHLHVGDEGMKKVFRKLAQGLAPGGVLVMEPQPMKSYRQAFRKQVMPSHVHMWSSLKFLPDLFPEFLQKDCRLQLLQKLTVDGSTKGFDRPIFVFQKGQDV
mmetsp:Transcript_5651/g.15800  ORF Transcript_5651/g.15800 Transcript_5651/m.15800 type:complete len:540 (-) Transcript_5651:1787-3406(-)